MLAKYIREANTDYLRVRRQVPLGPLRTAPEYDRGVAVLDEIVDEIGKQETHPLADLAETLALAIAAYEEVHVPVPDVSGPAVTKKKTGRWWQELRESIRRTSGSVGD